MWLKSYPTGVCAWHFSEPRELLWKVAELLHYKTHPVDCVLLQAETSFTLCYRPLFLWNIIFFSSSSSKNQKHRQVNSYSLYILKPQNTCSWECFLYVSHTFYSFNGSFKAIYLLHEKWKLSVVTRSTKTFAFVGIFISWSHSMNGSPFLPVKCRN